MNMKRSEVLTTNKATMEKRYSYKHPQGKWYKHNPLGKRVWNEGTNFAVNNPNHDIFLGCSPLDSPTGLDERRRILFDMTPKQYSDLLGGMFEDYVDIPAETEEEKRKRKKERDKVKDQMRNGLTESTERINAASSLTIVNTRTVSIMGVEHTFQFNQSMEEIFNAVVLHRDVEALDGVAKAQGMIQLLSLPLDQFSNSFDGLFDINAPSFVASKIYVLQYATKLREASTFTAPSSSAEQSNRMEERVTALEAATRTTDSNFRAIASSVGNTNDNMVAAIGKNCNAINAERVERIAEQDILHRKFDALTLEVRGATPHPTPTPKKKERAEARPVSVRRSARIETARKHGA